MAHEQLPVLPHKNGSKKGRTLRCAKKISVLLVSLLVTLVACEVILWEIGYEYEPLEITVEGAANDWRKHHAFDDRHFTYDPELIWRPRRNYSVFNAQGFRGRPLSEHKTAGEFRIFAVGDSNTLGWDDGHTTKDEHKGSWPGCLQDRLDSLGEGFTVVNAGVYGYSSFQGLRRMQEIMRWEPDMVLLSFGSNDAFRVSVSDAEFAADFPRSSVAALFLKSKIWQVVLSARDRLSGMRSPAGPEDLVPRVSVREYQDNLRAAIEIARKRNVHCILLTRPFIGDSREDPFWWKNFAPEYIKATRQLGAASDVQVIDIYAHFKDREDCFADESHFTTEGHRLAAEIILEEIRPLLPIGASAKSGATKPESENSHP